jgi:hypothetical protein
MVVQQTVRMYVWVYVRRQMKVGMARARFVRVGDFELASVLHRQR